MSAQLYVCWSHPMDTIVLKGSLVRKLPSYGRMSMVSFVIMSTTAVRRWEQYTQSSGKVTFYIVYNLSKRSYYFTGNHGFNH